MWSTPFAGPVGVTSRASTALDASQRARTNTRLQTSSPRAINSFTPSDGDPAEVFISDADEQHPCFV